MRPDKKTNEAFLYCLAVAAKRYDIEVLFTTAMSNHHHTGIHDKHGNYPAFLEYFHKLFAKCQNSLRGRWENFWAAEQTSVVRLVDPQDVLNKLIYSLCNPVEASLVEKAGDWPGVSSLNASLNGEVLEAKRPEHFFRPNGPMPEAATLHIARPAGFEGLSAGEWSHLVATRIEAKEEQYGKERKKSGQKTLGVRRVLKQRWFSRPKSHERRRALSPRIAAKNKWRRIEALLSNRRFQQAYREARLALKAGVRDVRFPAGTYWLKRFAHVVCQEQLQSSAV